MILYEISTGKITDDNGQLLGFGYSGNGDRINDPTQISVVGHGPIPIGTYSLGTPVDRPESVGHFAIPLIPDASNIMFGRSGFFIHGDNPAANHSASDGCIVTGPTVRQAISQGSGQLSVVA
jgi:Protein of unknown function (DUF2778)